MKIACGIEYDGTDYHGFQRQRADHGPTVQGVLEAAIARISDVASVVHGAGRTDAGVHASGQVIHFQTGSRLTPALWMRALNAVLPNTIAVRWLKEVPEHFHARFSAVSRSYRYTIWNDVEYQAPTALLARYSYYCPRVLAVDLMQDACRLLLGRQDFGAFGRSPDETNPGKGEGQDDRKADKSAPTGGTVRTILEASCRREARYLAWGAGNKGTMKGACIYCDFTADAFLTGMVRRIVGTLLLVGQRRLSLDEFASIVQRAEKTHPGSAAPPHGLCLVWVNYPEEFGVE